MVSARDQAAEVKNLVEQMKADGRPEPDMPATVHRPWGNYRSIDTGDGFQVKHITVNPGGQLSLQKHQHRAEHWVVVNGTARVTCGSENFVLTANQSTYIPAGEIHRLENIGSQDLHLIEVQSGSYLGEDDIVRFEDNYGRTDYTGG
jgi:mannose-6-phosphate isomerase-like protein (cupin superfamily)